MVDDVSLTVEPGKVHVLLGENGAGKSTLIKMMSGIYQPDKGHIEADGKTVRIPDVNAARNLGIAVIHQELNLVPELSIMENLFLGHIPATAGFVSMAQMRRKARAAVERIGLSEDISTPMGELGVARQQMVEIAKALMQNASVLILDEPTAALTRRECEQLFTIMEELKKQDVAMVFISHHLDEIKRIGDVVTVLRDGKYIDTVKADTPEKELVRLMVGRNIDNQYPHTGYPQGEVLLKVDGLTRQGAIDDVSFELHAGEVVGLAGLVIAGRLHSAQPQAAQGYEMDAIAAVVIGGASLSGGKGKISGTFVGAILLALIRNGLNILNVSSFWQQVVIGLVIALAVSIDTLRRKQDTH